MNVSPRVLLAAAVLLAGCGQKGPLYLPDTPQGEVVTRPAPAPAAAPTTPGAPSTSPAAGPVPAGDADARKPKTGTPPPGK